MLNCAGCEQIYRNNAAVKRTALATRTTVMFYTQGSRPLELHSCYIRPTGIFDTNNHNEQAELLMRHRAVVLATARDTG